MNGAESPEKGRTWPYVGYRAAAGLMGSIVGLMTLLASPTTAAADPTGAQASLSGTGSGQVLIAPVARDHGTFAVEITVNVKGATAGTVYTIYRAPDTTPDGNCTATPIPTDTLLTSAGGAGAVHFKLQRPAPFVSGTRFDVAWLLVGNDGTQLASECVTVTVK
jgi:hypothetical protein